MKKVVIARLIIQKDKLEAFSKTAKTMSQQSQAEQGCIIYKLHQDVEDSSSFLFYEEYQDQVAVDIHTASSHYKEFLELVAGMLKVAPIIDVYP